MSVGDSSSNNDVDLFLIVAHHEVSMIMDFLPIR